MYKQKREDKRNKIKQKHEEKEGRSQQEIIKAIEERTERNLDVLGEFKVY